MKFRTTRPQAISRLYSETGSLRSDRIIAFVYRNKLPGGLVRALLALAKALVWRESGKENPMKIKGHTLGAWFNHLLFKLLPPKWYLRTQGIKVRRESNVRVTVTYHRQGELALFDKRQAQVKFIDIRAVIKMVFLWFEYGFCEPVPELSPYIPRHLDNKRYYIPSDNILKVEWYDPVLEDHISIENPSWRSDGHDSDSPV